MQKFPSSSPKIVLMLSLNKALGVGELVNNSLMSLFPGGSDCPQVPASQGLLCLTTSLRTRVLCK